MKRKKINIYSHRGCKKKIESFTMHMFRGNSMKWHIYIVIMIFLLFWWRPCNFGCNIQDITLDSIFNHIWNKTNNWEGREKGASAFFPVEWGFPVSNLNRYYRFLIQTWLAWLCDWEFPMPGTPFLPVFCLLLPLHPRPGFWLFPREKK